MTPFSRFALRLRLRLLRCYEILMLSLLLALALSALTPAPTAAEMPASIGQCGKK